jgi:NTP pyrophosphatase (non-canonical NTP hydrolase)
MELNEYQKKAMGTCLPSCDNFSYMLLNLVGEVGEFAGKVAKRIRKEELLMGGAENAENKLTSLALTRGEQYEILDDLKSEAGDILWQLAGLCKVMGWDLNDVAQCNLDKLANRKKEGTIITHQDH